MTTAQALKPITPQAPARVAWEELVLEAIEAEEGMTRSDAQAICDAQSNVLDSCFAQGESPLYCAGLVVGASVVDAAAPAAHTPEPWGYENGEIYGFEDGEQVLIATATRDPEDALTEFDAANIPRIVACVNACEGMADPAAAIATLRTAAERELSVRLERDSIHVANNLLSAQLVEARQSRDALESKCLGLQAELGRAEAELRNTSDVVPVSANPTVRLFQRSYDRKYIQITAIGRAAAAEVLSGRDKAVNAYCAANPAESVLSVVGPLVLIARTDDAGSEL